MSYDPFRPSRHQIIPVDADHAKITLLDDSSISPKREKDADSRIRELIPKSIPRQNTSGPWASTMPPREGSRVFRKSASYKRQIQLPHRYRNSSLQQSPPPRPRSLAPLLLQQQHVPDADSNDRDPLTSSALVRASAASMSPLQIRSHEEATNAQKPDGETENKNRSSPLWEDRTRQVGGELSNLCDEVFKGRDTEPDGFNKGTEVEKLRTFARKSLDLLAFRLSEIDSYGSEPSVRLRPLLQPPGLESTAMQTYLELAQTKERLEKHAKALGSNQLDCVIQQIQRLMEAEAIEIAEQHRKSSRRFNQSLHDVGAWSAWNHPSTIRPVDDSETRERPLTIGKKASEPVIRPCKYQDGQASKGKLKAGNASTSALEKNLDPGDIKRASNKSKGNKWFCRNAGSTRSSKSGSDHDLTHRQHTACDDVPFLQPAKDKESTTRQILRFFGKRDKRIADCND